MIAVFDFGSQYTWLISRRIREMGVKSEVFPYTDIKRILKKRNDITGIILSGSPASIDEKNPPVIDKSILGFKKPVLGICYGMQMLTELLGGTVGPGDKREYGETKLFVKTGSKLFAGIKQKKFIVWMSHYDTVKKIPKGFKITSATDTIPAASVENVKRNIYMVQFHPEVSHSKNGTKILKNFVFNICKSKKDWDLSKLLKNKIKEIKEQVGDGKVIVALSGGVDSSVAAVMVERAIGNRLYPVFVDTGLIRYGDVERINNVLIRQMGINVKIVDAKKRFFKKLKNITNPERKRKIIGHEFIKVFEEESKKITGITHLVQGTLYPDVIESAGAGTKSVVIKSHHNVGGLPDKMKLELVEPLRDLFKDEVRKIGKKLGMPDDILYQHPFPGPGLAIRILGDVTEYRLNIVKEADRIVEEELKKAGVYYKLWQGFAVLLPIKTVGIMGDKRTYDNVIALRMVESTDAMTSNWAKVPHSVLGRISSRIVNEIDGVNRVVYDLTNKPPATIEWE